ncbi:hypothetical protein GCM10027451_30140 [Geodermatophilus aquaeductus]|uniref:Uncharacterized protein n=1 Tax=Geodermatophilus aquaeductus TaxID=1564161 RepID=A0A521FUR5_9ACTN|nr:hypothetical protein [Geodermatophilus aquaeductus]SMO99844.1 hypothetical protein SAMN06273567_11946 [Geodermatophilus aquaeductus]
MGGPPDGRTTVRTAVRAPLRWRASPVDLALQASRRAASGELPVAFCAEVGRRMLLAQLQFGEWVLRRVETIAFQDERTVVREMTIDLRVREDAPVFVDDGGVEYWLVPLTLMRRRTLVDFHIRTEDDQPVRMSGLRLAQQLDEAILMAAAATTTRHPNAVDARDAAVVTEFIQTLVAGRRDEVRECWDRFEATSPSGDGPLEVLRGSAVFTAAARKLRNGFTLYAFLRVDAGRHRLLRVSFVEPIRWVYQWPDLRCPTAQDPVWTYRANQRVPARYRWDRVAAALGWASTRVRFQVPSAERAASYHVEITAPPGVRIGRATLLAGRPNEPEHRLTADHEENDTLTVGLHGVEVPHGSLCRAQVDLRVQSSGWLATMAIAGLAVCAVLASATWHVARQEHPGPEQGNNMVVLLLTTAAAAATLVAHRESSGIASRLVVGVRTVAAVCIALPVVAAGFVAYTERQPDEPPEPSTSPWLLSLTIAAGVLSLHLVVVWYLSRRVERAGRPRSPWDMTPDPPVHRWFTRPSSDSHPHGPVDRNLLDATRVHHFDRPAIGIRSSEAYHERYDVTDSSLGSAVARLTALRAAPDATPSFTCGDPTRCPRRDSGACLVMTENGTWRSGFRRGRTDAPGR